jgi:integrase
LIIDGWAREVTPKPATRDQWGRYIKDLEQVTGVADPSALSRNDVVKWKDRLLERGDSPKTVNDSKLAAVKAVLKWAVDNGKVTVHVAQGVSVHRKAKPGKRMEGFDDKQAAAILAAAEEARSPVYRWIPLLCALSGARVAEIAQLGGEDVRETDGIWHMQIRAEAGSVKNVTSERDVPLPYLISSGFLNFAKGPASW